MASEESPLSLVDVRSEDFAEGPGVFRLTSATASETPILCTPSPPLQKPRLPREAQYPHAADASMPIHTATAATRSTKYYGNVLETRNDESHVRPSRVLSSTVVGHRIIVRSWMADVLCDSACLHIHGPVPNVEGRTRPNMLLYSVQDVLEHVYALQATPSIVPQCLLGSQLGFSLIRVALEPPRG